VFGHGVESNELGSGPEPALCNIQLAVARVLKMSGAAEVIVQLIEDGDDSHNYLFSEDFCNILTARLFTSGAALVVQ